MKLVWELVRIISHFCLMLANIVVNLIVGIFGGGVNLLSNYASDKHQKHRRKKGERPSHLHRPGRDDTL